MYDLTITITSVLGIFTFLGHIALVLFLLALLFKATLLRGLFKFVKENLLLFGFVIAFLGTALSLFYSELAGFPPCEFCWYQRIFLYPLVILFGLALKRGDKSVCDFALIMSVIGFLIGAYQYFGQMMAIHAPSVAVLAPCAPGEVSCTEFYFLEFGYITMPLMSTTAFLALVIILLINKYSKA